MSNHYMSHLFALCIMTTLAVLSLYNLYSDVTGPEQSMRGPQQSIRSIDMIVRGKKDLIHGHVQGRKLETKNVNTIDAKATSLYKDNVPSDAQSDGKLLRKERVTSSKGTVKMKGAGKMGTMTGTTTTASRHNNGSAQQHEHKERMRYLVHVCDPSRPCSGWGDRQRGVVSAFLLATVTGRKFLINMTSPCDIRQFLIPSHYNWDIGQLNPAGKSSIVVGGVSASAYHQLIRRQHLNKIYPQDVIYLRSNSDLLNTIKSNPNYKSKLPTWAKKSRWETFKAGWDILMKPRVYIQEKVDSILQNVNLNREGDLVCAHVRLGQNPSLPNDSPNRNSLKSVQVLWRFLKPYVRNSSGVVITSDSMEIRRQARLQFGNKSLDSGGVILHIDRQRGSGEACRGFESAILDQLLLRNCHVLVVSASNFSVRAAHLRGRRDKLFIFKNSKVVPFNMGS